MIKLLLCLVVGVGTAAMLLQLRQERLNLTFQTDKLHNQIQASQAELWNQQLNIAIVTAPNSVAAAAKGQNLQLSPANPPKTPATPVPETSADAR
jgi:hypothetical protein